MIDFFKNVLANVIATASLALIYKMYNKYKKSIDILYN